MSENPWTLDEGCLSLVTWNLNSVRVRTPRLLRFLKEHGPDVLCLQELKAEASAFPTAKVKEAGYEVEILGQRTYNGVAVLSRGPITRKAEGLGDPALDGQARFLVVETLGLGVASAYMPNGQSVESEKYAFKRAWLDRLNSWLRTSPLARKRFLLLGDFNIAADDRDVANPESWEGSVLYNDEMRSMVWERFREGGLFDLFRVGEKRPGIYSWWDYRNLGFPKNDGLRIDHVFGTEDLVPLVRRGFVDREERKETSCPDGTKPSDHAPLGVVIDPVEAA